MKHYGDIKEMSGFDIPIVDVITGGSPCQDLSVAGKRAGLAGQRSGLFMEQIRIVSIFQTFGYTKTYAQRSEKDLAQGGQFPNDS